MSKNLVFFLLLVSCNSQPAEYHRLEARIDSLQNEIAKAYKPGFGEFMTFVQIHHAKLWFAGESGNWKLAQFELDEVGETIEALKIIQSNRKETPLLELIIPALDSVGAAVRLQNASAFRLSYDHLTKTCNECHRATGFQFNIVKTPDRPPFSNQAFHE